MLIIDFLPPRFVICADIVVFQKGQQVKGHTGINAASHQVFVNSDDFNLEHDVRGLAAAPTRLRGFMAKGDRTVLLHKEIALKRSMVDGPRLGLARLTAAFEGEAVSGLVLHRAWLVSQTAYFRRAP